MALTQTCSICRREFEVEFSYQMEERSERDPDENEQPGFRSSGFVFFCSQACLAKSHFSGLGGLTRCDACSSHFQLELAAQVLFVGGRRRYACRPDCRAQILEEARGARLGELAAVATPTPADARAARVIAIFNHKGGTGKTTTAVTVAAGLAERGKRVLLVDTDGQGNVAASLALKSERSLYHVVVMGLQVSDAVARVRPNLDVLPSNETLAAAELYLAGRRQRDRVLAERLAAARQMYDFVIVDCSPSLSLMNQNALVFADSALCPVACDYLSLVGVRQVLRTFKHVNKLLGHPVQLWGVLPTLFDPRARICHEALAALREHFGERCLEPIRLAIKVKEAPAQGKTLLEYAPASSASSDYAKVVARLLEEPSVADATQPVRAAGGVG